MEVAAVKLRNVPTGHETHALDAVFGLYFPAAQAVQFMAPKFELTYPAGQLEQTLLPLEAE